MLNEQNLLKVFKEKRVAALNLSELKKLLKIHPHQMPVLRRLVRRMVEEGQLVNLKKGLFAIPVTSGLITGILEMNPRGFGFVRPLEDIDDIYIHRENIASAMDRDRVLVSLVPGGRREGRIVKVLERTNHEVIGTLEKSKKVFFVIPDNPKFVYDIIIPSHSLQGAYLKDKVVVKLTQWPSKHLNPQGVVVEILGKSTDPKLDSLSISKNYGFPLQFPKKVEKESQQLHEVIPHSEMISRWDLTHLLAFTIDPMDARDFDDAISIQATDQGWNLGIHIADVSFYVPPDSDIDQEAMLRGCTIYFSDRAIRMLPEKLSREICSLDEGKNRLAKSILVEFNQEGEILNWRIGKSIIRSKKRFSYEEVTQLLVNPDYPHKIERPMMESLFQAEKLTKILFLKRLERGALELDIPELEIIQDSNGHVLNLEIHPKEISHRLVEECMLMANYLVARLLVEKRLPGLFRIHEKPSTLDQEEFKRFVSTLGITLKSKLTSKSLQAFAETFKGKPLSNVVNLALLRSLKVAQYSPRNTGHFALALDFYTHFTSPIRRYPDLFVHQILDHYFLSSKTVLKKDLRSIARHCSDTERKADKAEQEFNELKRLRFLKDRFEKRILRPSLAVIVDVREFGIFIREENTLAEGLIHISSLRDDFYIFDSERMRLVGRRGKRQFKLGDQVRVRVIEVDLYKKQINFELAG
jgi:ribonuclease R